MSKLFYWLLLLTPVYAVATDCELLNRQATKNGVMTFAHETFQLKKHKQGEPVYLYSAPNQACRTDTELRSDEISTLIVYFDYGNFYSVLYFLKDNTKDISWWVKIRNLKPIGYRIRPQ